MSQGGVRRVRGVRGVGFVCELVDKVLHALEAGAACSGCPRLLT